MDIRKLKYVTAISYIPAADYSPKTDRIFDIGDVAFTHVDEEDKQRYAGRMKETGSHQGYKLRNYWVRHEKPEDVCH